MQEHGETLTKSETINLRQKYVGPSCTLFYKTDPLKIVRAEGQYMYDEKGNRFLDCINNVAHVGHCHPEVVKAGCDQMATLNTNNRFLHDNLVVCAQKLTSLMPKPLSVCFFVNSGSEANDLALRLARTYTKNNDIVIIDHAYHGHLSTLIDISPYKFNLPGGSGKQDWVHVAPIPDSYRGQYTKEKYPGDELGTLYAEEVRALCKEAKNNGRSIAGFIAESMLSCGGQVIPPSNYFKNVYKIIREAGGVCIADEVQTGFGRVGKSWWAFELQDDDLIPDIVTVGKPMGNGHPVAAVITTREIAQSFKNTGVEYFNTYGGNPVSCAVALAVMNVIEKKNLKENATRVGNHLINSLKIMCKKHTVVGDVRGVGLFVGIELVKDQITKEPATDAAVYVVKRMRENFILLSSDGPYNNVLKLKPPMVFSLENADHFIKILDELLLEVKDGVVPTNDVIHANNVKAMSKDLQDSFLNGPTERKIRIDEAESMTGN
ncbi:Hypothetical predicted protein [Cloeon dipterum]|uniref:Alanine--glyoxylate aminotransferase 2-like n=1 Tax=Cloeon dipterum TaxID=197152 RepID=A0A8S1DTB4_9INSE|nr:Hypothetical predicted protein [Cloeon dipterum]